MSFKISLVKPLVTFLCRGRCRFAVMKMFEPVHQDIQSRAVNLLIVKELLVTWGNVSKFAAITACVNVDEKFCIFHPVNFCTNLHHFQQLTHLR